MKYGKHLSDIEHQEAQDTEPHDKRAPEERGEHIRRTLHVYPLTDGSEFQASAAERKNPDRACHSR